MGAEGISVLVVDDNPQFRGVLRDVVAATAGLTCVGEATSGEAALEACDALAPDLVLMDKRMPGIGGIEAARRIVLLLPRTVVALISIYRPDDLPPGAHTCGAHAVLRKDRLRPCLLRELWANARPGTAALP